MKPSRDDKRQGHANWLQSLSEARNQTRNALMQASVDVSDPERVLWPTVPREAMTREHEAVARLQATLLDYVEHLEPYAPRCGQLWVEDIVPPYEFDSGETLPVVLSEIERWADKRVAVEERTPSQLNPRARSTEEKRVHLPARYARETFRQANKCIERLQLGVEIENRTAGKEMIRKHDPGIQHGDE